MHQPTNPESLSNRDLMKELVSDASLLVQRQVKLATLEGKEQIKRETKVAEWMGAGGALANAGVILLLVAAALGIGVVLDNRYWAGALIVGAVLIFAAAVVATVGWTRRVKTPLGKTRRELEKEMTWAKHQVTT